MQKELGRSQIPPVLLLIPEFYVTVLLGVTELFHYAHLVPIPPD
jgi:hypothetical protein